MQIAPTMTSIQPDVPFASASFQYSQALEALTFAPNERVDVAGAVATALDHATKGIAMLAPVLDSSDMFVGRNARASVEAATTGVTALRTALQTLSLGGGVSPQIPVDTFLTVARNSIQQADSALWWE